MAELDLDALVDDQLGAARAEAAAEPKRLKWRGETFDLPPELPVAFLEKSRREGDVEAMRCLFGDDGVRRFMDTGPTIPELMVIVAGILGLYGLGPGKVDPSSLRSRITGRSSKPTSNGSTGSSSPSPVSAPVPLAPGDSGTL